VRKLLLILLCSISCNNAPAESPVPGQLDATGDVVTTVNGQPITQGMIDATMALLPEHIQKQIEAAGQQEQVKEQMVLGELLYREALKRGLHKDAKVQTTIALSAREALAQNLLEQIVDERATDEAMQKWYQDHIIQFTKSEVDVSHILVKDKALIDKIKTKLDAGGDFAALAAKHSVDPGVSRNGGRLGKIARGRTVPQFEKAAFSTPTGTYSAPVQSQFGWHIVLVHEKINDQKLLSDVTEDVKQGISKEIIQAYFEEIKSSATIENAAGEKTEDAGDAEGKGTKAKKKGKNKLKLKAGGKRTIKLGGKRKAGGKRTIKLGGKRKAGKKKAGKK